MTHPRTVIVLVASVLLLGLTACAPDDGRVEWRDLSLEVPDGWVVAERDDRKLSLANTEFGPDRADELEAAVFLSHEPDGSIDRWRELADDRGGEIETDGTLELDGEPASRLVFSHDANGTLLREMVVIVPSRDIVMLFQPVVLRGSEDGPATFERHRDRFEQLLASLRFEDAGGGDAPRDLSTSGRPSRAAVAAISGGAG